MFSDAISMSAESTASATEVVGAAVMVVRVVRVVRVVLNAVAVAGNSTDGNTLPIKPWRI